MIYLNESYIYRIRNLFTNSNIWEGLFIDINGGNLCRTFTIGNIYRPPHDNNNNANIQQFISELSPIIDIIQRENTYAAIVGDFNINFPTRFARHSCSLIDQIFFKTPHKKHVSISSSIIFSNISDHLPCTVNLGISEHTTKQQKYVRTRVIKDTAVNNFRSELTEIDMSALLNANLATDPNTDYDKFEKIITKTYDKHFPEKRVKFNKYKHKRSNWITSGILKSIEFRDKLYKRLKICSPDNSEYDLLKHNLKIYNGYLNHCIRAAKKEFYHNEFNKHKNDIRKTWDALKEIINKKTFKSDLPSSFVHEGVEVIGLKNVADKFNEYFTEIGPKLAQSIDTANKAPFNHYLTTPARLHLISFTQSRMTSKK